MFQRHALAIFACAALLAACSGDRGAAGPPGLNFRADTARVPAGRRRVVARVSQKTMINRGEILTLTVPTGGRAPVVTFKLTNDLTQGLTGLLPADWAHSRSGNRRPGAGGASSEWQSYVTKLDAIRVQANRRPPRLSVSKRPATAPTNTRLPRPSRPPIPGRPTYNEVLTDRMGVEVRNNAPTINTPFVSCPPAAP